MPRRRKFAPIAVAPSLMTLCNLICGFLAVFYASRADEGGGVGPYTPIDIAAGLIFVGMIFDAFDGAVARATRSTSRFGAQLDSMADMVTFGVAPAFLIVELNQVQTPFFAEMPFDTYFDRGVLLIAVAYAACAALRLARFNAAKDAPSRNEADDEEATFDGLPSPAAAGAVAAMALLCITVRDYVDPQLNTRFAQYFIMAAAGLTLVLALLMVSPLPYSHLFSRYLKGREPFHYIGLGVVLLILLLTIPQWAAAAGFLAYCLSSPIAWLAGRPQADEDDDEPTPPTAPADPISTHRLN